MARAAPIYLALLGAILTVIALMLLVRLTHLLLLVFISALFAAAMTGPVDFLERWRIPRLISASLLQLAVVAVIAVGAWLVVPPLLDQGAGAVDTVPERLQQYEGLQKRYDELRQEYPQLGSLDEQVSSVGERLVSAVGNRLVDLPLRHRAAPARPARDLRHLRPARGAAAAAPGVRPLAHAARTTASARTSCSTRCGSGSGATCGRS